jgi:hypothetical protein
MSAAAATTREMLDLSVNVGTVLQSAHDATGSR